MVLAWLLPGAPRRSWTTAQDAHHGGAQCAALLILALHGLVLVVLAAFSRSRNATVRP